MTTLTREALLGKSARRYLDVVIGDGETVRIQSLSEADLGEYDAAAYDKQTYKVTPQCVVLRRRLLVALSLVDDEGKRLFKSSEVDSLLDVDAKVVGMIHNAAVEFNSLQDPEADVEDDAKN
jgi:hypothetical protein